MIATTESALRVFTLLPFGEPRDPTQRVGSGCVGTNRKLNNRIRTAAMTCEGLFRSIGTCRKVTAVRSSPAISGRFFDPLPALVMSTPQSQAPLTWTRPCQFGGKSTTFAQVVSDQLWPWLFTGAEFGDPLPFAIIIQPGSAKPVVLASSDCEQLLDALHLFCRSIPRAEGGSVQFPDKAAARKWLAARPEPSGWYETFDEVASRLN